MAIQSDRLTHSSTLQIAQHSLHILHACELFFRFIPTPCRNETYQVYSTIHLHPQPECTNDPAADPDRLLFLMQSTLPLCLAYLAYPNALPCVHIPTRCRAPKLAFLQTYAFVCSALGFHLMIGSCLTSTHCPPRSVMSFQPPVYLCRRA